MYKQNRKTPTQKMSAARQSANNPLKRVRVSTRAEWRRWLLQNHKLELQGIWLEFPKIGAGKEALDYEASVEEALCFGWIDSLIKRIDEKTYCRKFTPRKNDSRWSHSNRQRVEKLIKEGSMTEFGLAKVKAAKASGIWELDPRPRISLDAPPELSRGLERNRRAKIFFENLAPCYRKHFIAWIVTAKKPETRVRRLNETLALLGKGERLGLT